MKRKDYINALRAQLRRLPSDDVEEIVKEFDTHFEMGVADGLTETEIAAKLGSPEEVAQIYLSDAIPDFDPSGAQNVCTPQMPIIPVKTGMVIDRGVGPQTAAGFASGGFAKPLVNASPRNTAPKPEPPSFENAHTGAKDKETYEEPHPQTGKKYDLPDYTQYPSQDPNTVKKAGKEHNLLFSVLFTIFIFVPLWFVALAILLLIIGTPVVMGLLSGVLFTWAMEMTSAVAGTVCLAISLAFGAIAMLFVAFFAVKGFILGTYHYIRYIIKINGSKGGNA